MDRWTSHYYTLKSNSGVFGYSYIGHQLLLQGKCLFRKVLAIAWLVTVDQDLCADAKAVAICVGL
eukprot:scaffold401956_cov21-Prasinocladus_malaysianus.AAC.1